MTDLEGVAGVDSFAETRSSDRAVRRRAMTQLAAEVNACIEGIRAADPAAAVDVWDGHGPGGLEPGELVGGRYLREGRPYLQLAGYDAVLFVGQHAMAGTAFAPLCHTYSSRTIAYYKLNGIFIGEFGARALIAGRQGVPTIFLSGDDKATLEAQLFVPEIETVAVKRGRGLEAADHTDPAEACQMIRAGAARAVARIGSIPPLTGIEPPYTFELRYLEPPDKARWDRPGVEWLDARTLRWVTDDLTALPF